MRIRKNKRYAVLTGDVVDSSRLSPADRKKLPQLLRKAGQDVKRVYTDVVPLPIDLFRGDGWQLLVDEPTQALTVALAYRAALRIHTNSSKIDSRVSIGIGSLAFLPGETISEGDGEALQASGRGLEAMDRRVRLKVHGAAGHSASVLDALTWLIDTQAQAWTARQSLAVSGALRGWTQEKIAAKWKPKPISQQAVAQHLDRSGWYAVEQGITAYRELVAS